jgi:hypothetical protein
MKKVLLFIMAAAISLSAIGQNNNSNNNNNNNSSNNNNSNNNNNNNGHNRSAQRLHAPKVDVKAAISKTTDILPLNTVRVPQENATVKRVPPPQNEMAYDIRTLGSAANAFGNWYIGKTLLSYEPTLNTVVQFHRNNSAITSELNNGHYRYDKSTDNGDTWSLNQGPVYGAVLNATAAEPHAGRYPVATIGNPDSNTDPNNAYVAYAGVWHTGTAGSTWKGVSYGVGQLNNAYNTEHYDSLNEAGNMLWVEDIFATKQNVIWRMGAVEADNAGTYADTLRLYKGVWTGTDYTYTEQNLWFPVNPDLAARPYDMNVAFSDDGQIGYAVCITNNDPTYTLFTQATMYLTMYTTLDGGNTWTPFRTDLDVQHVFDPILANYGNPDSCYTVAGWGADYTRPDFDMVVDANGNLHIIVAILPGINFGESEFTPTAGTWGVFDLYTTDHGTTWNGQLLSKPDTYEGHFGAAAADVTETIRPFASRNYDGTKLFFGWFTTSVDFGVPTNDFPNLYVMGYDVTSGLWTPEMNMTHDGGAADGSVFCGLGSYYVRESSCTFELPVSFMINAVTSGGPDITNPVQFLYLDNITMACSDFTNTGSAIPLPTIIEGIADNLNTAVPHFSVSLNYPNPFKGKTNVDVKLPSSMDVSIEVTNIMGQSMFSKVYKNLSAGVNTLVIDGSGLAKGLYTYKVIAGKEVITQIMNVQ